MRKSLLGVICSAALLMAVTAEPVAAQNFNRHTVLTFSAPVELPGITLPAGTYTFRLSDSTSDRHVVHVFDANGEKHLATLLAMPATRSAISEETVVTFRETAANEPLPIRYWYFPNDQFGQEFAYPKERALAIAAATGESVLSVDGDQLARVEPMPVAEPAPMQPAVTTDRLPDTASGLPLVGLIGLLALGGALLTRVYRGSAA